jgi:prevent-host-death family protein
MTTISVEEIEKDVAGYLKRVEAGENFIITRANKPMAAIQSVPVIEARADAKGHITHVKLEGGSQFISVEQAINMADRGELSNAHAVHKTDGGSYLRTNPNSLSAATAKLPRPAGLAAGQFVVPDDFDAPLPDDVLKEFEG